MVKISAKKVVDWNHKIAKRSESLLLTQKSGHRWDDVLKPYSIREDGEYSLK